MAYNNTNSFDDPSTIYLKSGVINTKTQEAKSLRKPVESFSGKHLHLVQFNGAIKPEWYKLLIDAGVHIVDYIPNYTYLVYGDAVSLQRIQTKANEANSPITWDAPYADLFRINPTVYKNRKEAEKGAAKLSSDFFEVQLVKDTNANAATLKHINEIKTKEIINSWEILHYVNLIVGLNENGIKEIASRSDVISIAPYFAPQLNDEKQNQILAGNLTGNNPTPSNYLAYLFSKGFTQTQFDKSDFVVDVSDTSIDLFAASPKTPTPTHFALYREGKPTNESRLAYTKNEGTNLLPPFEGCSGHGTLNAHIIAGFVPDDSPFDSFPHADEQGFRYGLGVCPFVKVGGSKFFNENRTFTNPNFVTSTASSYKLGARISTNGWGISSGESSYNSIAQTYDLLVRDAVPSNVSNTQTGNQEYVILFSAGNNGNSSYTIGNPAAAKNVITVGGAENVRPFSGQDNCEVADTKADNANDIADFSSRGPTTDGRTKPEILAPATHITGGVMQTKTAQTVSGNGKANSCFSGEGICGGVNNKFFPDNQEWYTASSGTSHAAAAVGGGAALIRQHFINQNLKAPSPAMTKAVMANSARYMTGSGANDNLFSDNQGMGMLNLNNFFELFTSQRILRDQLSEDLFTASGQQKVFTGMIADTNKPFRVTLAWTDARGSTAGNAYVNNLDLEVVINGQVYKGNNFSGTVSITEGKTDAKNNVESVFIPAGVLTPDTSSNFIIKIKATNIAGDGVPNNPNPLDQDFALVVSNAKEASLPAIDLGEPVIKSETCGSGLIADPNDKLTVELPLMNNGVATNAPVIVTLQAADGITETSEPQNYGVLAANSTVIKNFTFKVASSTTCGSTITTTFQLSGGTSGNITKTFNLGTLNTSTPSYADTFDSTGSLTLPAEWTTTNTGAGTNWTANNVSDTNSLFAPNAERMGTSELISPPILIKVADGQVAFKNWFDTEASATNPTLGYDGMVLEIKIGSGAFQDILEAGGTFVSGGYNRTIETRFGNPAAGRQAWSGVSGGGSSPVFIETVVNLPATAAGQSIQLKWKMASDESVAGAGVRIDDVKVMGQAGCTVSCGAGQCRFQRRNDYDGDGKTDFSTYRPTNTTWYVLPSSTSNFYGVQFGLASDKLQPGDYDGDGKTDVAVFRAGVWWWMESSTNNAKTVKWGLPDDIPVAGDYTGDGKTDLAVFRNGTWWVLKSEDGTTYAGNWGLATDTPLVGDFDGDCKADFAVRRTENIPAEKNTTFYILRSSSGSFIVRYGREDQQLAIGDYDGDGKSDLVVAWTQNGSIQWYGIGVANPSTLFEGASFGTNGDIAVPADYDGDGKTDRAIWRPSTGEFIYMKSASNNEQSKTTFGTNGDTPIARWYQYPLP